MSGTPPDWLTALALIVMFAGGIGCGWLARDWAAPICLIYWRARCRDREREIEEIMSGSAHEADLQEAEELRTSLTSALHSVGELRAEARELRFLLWHAVHAAGGEIVISVHALARHDPRDLVLHKSDDVGTRDVALRASVVGASEEPSVEAGQ
ncbi:hypothetical protein PQJ75_00835 [Rhodoplanes sp. TEM]|uniref:Uncharacterized protein n=1 Tax=Rhodoplanes tepidamans TaxID=200616 RepID=A0ABT5J570_RHOTP|nr:MULTISPECIES: hypothetical protein [Rhodoplanes]MDC7784798.1 hypothetical protein [Rhodoplanes tepidamans]MDC7982265.1 hypothetical protein [Rhodoplanes sp. TEM]MDQ0356272.1 hypothetical protein [Rhodoplanes tepidamans]